MLKFTTLMLLITFSPSTLSGQQKPKTIQNYLTTTFDTEARSLSPSFKGHNIKDVYKVGLEATTPSPRQEFETQEKYVARLAKLQTPIRRLVDANETTLAFVSDKERPSCKYDIDHSLMVCDFMLFNEKVSSLHSYSSAGFFLMEIVDETKQVSYVGENAYGAQRDISITKGNKWNISLVREDLRALETDGDGMYFNYSASFPMSVDDGKKLRDAIKKARFLVVGKLSHPASYEDKAYSRPTLDKPWGNDYNRYNIKFNPSQIWIINAQSGTIYGKKKIRVDSASGN